MPLASAVRRAAVALRDEKDRLLHPRRRERVLERLRSEPPTSVLFVCLGNICRSPFAARTWAERSTIPARSAGLIGPGRAPPPEALRAAQRHGLDHSDHRSVVVTSAMLSSAGAIFVFDRIHLAELGKWPELRRDRAYWLGDFDPEWSGKRAIIDPWGKPDVEFERTFERIDRCLRSAIGAVTSGGPGTSSATPRGKDESR